MKDLFNVTAGAWNNDFSKFLFGLFRYLYIRAGLLSSTERPFKRRKLPAPSSEIPSSFLAHEMFAPMDKETEEKQNHAFRFLDDLDLDSNDFLTLRLLHSQRIFEKAPLVAIVSAAHFGLLSPNVLKLLSIFSDSLAFQDVFKVLTLADD